MLSKNSEELLSAEEKLGLEPLDIAIRKAWGALIESQNPDGGWGRFKNNKTDLWNTSFIIDCLLKTYRFNEIKNEIKKQVEFLTKSCSMFMERYDRIKMNEQMKEPTESASIEPRKSNKIENHTIICNYALAHSVSILAKIKDIDTDTEHKNRDLLSKILGYLTTINKVNIENEYWGWGWDKFSSSNIYGTAIVVNALMDVREEISEQEREKRSELVQPICFGINWILRDQNLDGGWGVERGSDPKHTALVLLTLLRFLRESNDLKSDKNGLLRYKDEYIEDKVRKAGKWLCSQWPNEDLKFFRIQSSIPGKGWRAEDSRYVDRVGFESTAYALWALDELSRDEGLTAAERKEIELNLTDGLLWLLSSQERKGCWHEYEYENDKMSGSCYNFYPALGILVLSLFRREFAINKSKEKITERLLENKMILLARLSYFKDSKLISGPKKRFIFRIYPISFILSYQAAFVLAMLATLVVALFYSKGIVVNTGSTSFYLALIGVVIVFLIILVEIDLASEESVLVRVYSTVGRYLSIQLSEIERFFNRFRKGDPEIQDSAIEKAWEALVFSQNTDGGWGCFKNSKPDLWNTSFIIDCLLKTYRYIDIRKEIKKPITLIAEYCEEFVKSVYKDNKEGEIEKNVSQATENCIKPEKEFNIDYIDNYGLAHSLSVLLKTDNEKHRRIAQKVFDYLVDRDVRNEDCGWGWDKFSSSNVYGTAVVVNALMDAREEISLDGGDETVEDIIDAGINWILKDNNLDGGWGVERGSNPKHTALAVLTLLRFLKRSDRSGKNMNQDFNVCIYKCTRGGIEWLSSQWPAGEESRLLGVNSVIPEKGWRAEDSRYPNRVGFESTAYAAWALIESIEISKSAGLKELTEFLNLRELIERREVGNILKKGCRWLSWNQEWNGCWYEYENENGKMDGVCHNFYSALGILVLSLYRKKIEKSDVNKLISESLVLKEKLSTFTYPGLVELSKKLFIIFSWITLSLMIATALVVGYLGLGYIIQIGSCVSHFILKNPVYLAIAGILTAIAAWHKRVVWFLNKLKESITYGRKHS